MTEYLHDYNVVIDPEQGTCLPDGSWAQDVTLVLIDGPGPEYRRPVAITLTPSRHASSASSCSLLPSTPSEQPHPHKQKETSDERPCLPAAA
ncbi:MAG TPA: hypothetical protein VFJ24_02515 [Gaiellales bacterium]|nr:hypothetical protein [Gaiellales bacterium]